MAILKTTIVNGVTGTYWKTKDVYMAPDLSHAKVTLDLYASQAAYAAGSAAISKEVTLMDGMNMPFFLQALAGLAEAKLVGMSGVFNGGTVTGV